MTSELYKGWSQSMSSNELRGSSVRQGLASIGVLSAPFRLRYPPFQMKKVKRLEWLLARRPRSRFPWKLLSLFLLVALIAVLVQTYGLPSWLFRLTGR